jgi:hypothetical protein
VRLPGPPPVSRPFDDDRRREGRRERGDEGTKGGKGSGVRKARRMIM